VGCVKLSNTLPTNREKPMYLVSGSRDRTLKVWNCAPLADLMGKGESEMVKLEVMATQIGHEKDVNAIAISPNDAMIATAGQDRLIKLWNPELQQVATLKGHRRGVWDLQFSPVDKVLASCSGDKTLKIWSITDYTCLKTFEGHTASVLRVRFLNLGMQLMSAGADAVIKLWVIKTNECLSTFDEQHDDKIWALCLTKDEKHLVTGGADSTINVWTDNTSLVQEETQLEEAAKEQQDQQLRNMLRRKQYVEAAHLCLEMDLPRQLLGVLFSVDEEQDTESLNKIVSRAPQEHIVKLLEYIREWNTNSRRCVLAHKVLQRILSLVAPEDLRKVPNMPELIRSMLLYSDRHFKRLEQLLQKSYLVDYTVQSMHILTASSTSTDNMFESESDEEEDDIRLLLPPKVDDVVAIGSLTAASEPEVMEIDEDAEDEDEGDEAGEGDAEEEGDDEEEETEEVVAPPLKKSVSKSKTSGKEVAAPMSAAKKSATKPSTAKVVSAKKAVQAEKEEEDGPALGPGGSKVLNAKAFDMLLPVGDSDEEPLSGFDDMEGNWGGDWDEAKTPAPEEKKKKKTPKQTSNKTSKATATPEPTTKANKTPKATPKQSESTPKQIKATPKQAKTPKATSNSKATPNSKTANVSATPKQTKATPKQAEATPKRKKTSEAATPAKAEKSGKKAKADKVPKLK
jgi:WD40 repeat protein